MEFSWLRVILENMEKDLDEIKADVKALQKTKMMFEGGREAVRIIITVAVTLLTLWMSYK